ncbi:hypothetical protein [Marinomonas shanghaiensis]|uniref:hypothetical protein n=1 Tax=Marinomonas shanghaiensis TaxID=2202418 RepID=UPI000DBA3B9C|nr:hypothetical protein [Marinomonas shanghaiensis]
MSELDYVGFLAMLWIAFVFVGIYYILTNKIAQKESAEMPFLHWMGAFWRLPVGIIDLVFGRKLPDWMGPVIWFAPVYLVAIVKYSEFHFLDYGWAFSVGKLIIIRLY